MLTMRERERDLYETMWAIDSYRAHSPGQMMLPVFLDMVGGADYRDTVLDAGCGTGRGALALRAAGYEQVHMCDLTPDGLDEEARALPFTEACLWHDLGRQLPYLFGGKADWVYCCDVMEHLPTEFTMLAVANMRAVARKGVFMSVSLVRDNFGVLAGEPLHKTVQHYDWWKRALGQLGTLRESRDMIINGAYLLC